MSMFAAVAATLWIASPAIAAEDNPPARELTGVSSVKTASAPARRHYVWPRYHVTSRYASRLHYADAAPVGWHSYFGWRPALLMVGVGF
jgi:hypothetical protein